MYKTIITSFIGLLIFSTTGYAREADGFYVQFGNGIEGRIEVGKYEMFVAFHGNAIDDYNSRLGAIYKFKEGGDWHLGIGGGIAITQETFDAVPARPGEISGYLEDDSANDVLPFIQLEAVNGIFFIETFYSNTTYHITRSRIAVPGTPTTPPIFESRNDSAEGPGLGFFVGLRFKLK